MFAKLKCSYFLLSRKRRLRLSITKVSSNSLTKQNVSFLKAQRVVCAVQGIKTVLSAKMFSLCKL